MIILNKGKCMNNFNCMRIVNISIEILIISSILKNNLVLTLYKLFLAYSNKELYFLSLIILIK